MKTFTLSLLTLAACTASENVGNTSPNLDEVDAAVYPRVPVFGAERWHVTLGGAQEDRPGPIAVAPDGDLILAGTIQSTVNLGYGDVTSPHTIDSLGMNLFCDTAFLTRRSRTDGSPRWVRLVRPGNPTSNECASTSITRVVADGSGAVFVVGSYERVADFETQTLQSTRNDMFVAKYASDGALLWARGLGPSSAAYAQDAAVASDGSLAIVGWFRGTFMTPGGVVGDDAFDPVDNFVTVIEPDGAMRWARVFAGTALGGMHCNDLAFAADRSVTIACVSRQPFSFGGPVIPVTGQRGMLARFTATGDLVWSSGVGDEAAWNECPSIEVTLAGELVTLGMERGDERSLPNATVRAFDATGGERWMRRAQSGRTYVNAFATDAAGRALLQGKSDSPWADFGLGPIELDNGFLLALASDGTPLDQVILAGGPYTFLAALPDGSVAYSGVPAVGSHPGGFRTDIAFGLLDPPAP